MIPTDDNLEVPDFPTWVPGGSVGQLVPINDKEDDEPAVEVVVEQIFIEGGAAPEYKPGEELPVHDEALEYQIPPIVE